MSGGDAPTAPRDLRVKKDSPKSYQNSIAPTQIFDIRITD